MQTNTLELYESIQDLLLNLASERDLSRVLTLSVERLALIDEVALARVWLVRDGDICESCPMQSDCRTRVPCLHLAASAGQSTHEPEADWGRTNGEFRRIPVGARKVGTCAASAEAVWVRDTREDSAWISKPDWAAREGILGFGGQPVIYRGEVLGVLGVFTRARLGEAPLGSLRVVADHLAAAIATSRAFEENARLRTQLEAENELLRDDLDDVQAFGEIIGTSPGIREIEEQIRQVAPTDATVLVLGESGTGKELVAREIHRCSERAAHPMIRVNCASVPKDLFESEFFGHVKGAFTGAIRDRVGRFAAADGGTLFLDEVGEIPLDLQSKLLRVLQEGQYERVGDERTKTADVRIVAATNRDLAEEVKEGRFREDLFYRLNVFPIQVPPLRQRSADIPLLADHFLAKLTSKHRRPVVLSEADYGRLERYAWPGNIRELQNAIERAVITSKNGVPSFHLPDDASRAKPGSASGAGVLTDAELRELEKDNLIAALEEAGGRVYGEGGAAERLGLKPTTVTSKLKRLGIRGDTYG